MKMDSDQGSEGSWSPLSDNDCADWTVADYWASQMSFVKPSNLARQKVAADRENPTKASIRPAVSSLSNMSVILATGKPHSSRQLAIALGELESK